jgi:HAD superfamily hydrolase (TIGR01509 family)
VGVSPSAGLRADVAAATPGVEGVVFDLDDTLLATGPVWEECWIELCAQAGKDWTRQDTTASMGSGQWSRNVADRHGGDVAQVEQWCAHYMVEAIGTGRVGLYDGAIELIAAAADRVPVALASAAPRRFVDTAVTAFGLDRHLQTIVYADEVTDGKPAPDIYLSAAERLGADPRRCVAVEDSGSGIRSAHAAGMQVLAIPNQIHRPSPEILGIASHQADNTNSAVKILIGIINPTPRSNTAS